MRYGAREFVIGTQRREVFHHSFGREGFCTCECAFFCFFFLVCSLACLECVCVFRFADGMGVSVHASIRHGAWHMASQGGCKTSALVCKCIHLTSVQVSAREIGR